ncbi:unnamed protein product [Urochloa humidicola]
MGEGLGPPTTPRGASFPGRWRARAPGTRGSWSPTGGAHGRDAPAAAAAWAGLNRLSSSTCTGLMSYP